jgi:predicted amidophosphoribosyltransferase
MSEPEPKACPYCGAQIEDFDNADWCTECNALLNGDDEVLG